MGYMSEICAQLFGRELEKVLLKAEKEIPDVWAFARDNVLPLYLRQCNEAFMEPSQAVRDAYGLPEPKPVQIMAGPDGVDQFNPPILTPPGVPRTASFEQLQRLDGEDPWHKKALAAMATLEEEEDDE